MFCNDIYIYNYDWFVLLCSIVQCCTQHCKAIKKKKKQLKAKPKKKQLRSAFTVPILSENNLVFSKYVYPQFEKKQPKGEACIWFLPTSYSILSHLPLALTVHPHTPPFHLCLDCSPCILGQRVPNHHPFSEDIIPPEEVLTAILIIPGHSQHITLLCFLPSIG